MSAFDSKAEAEKVNDYFASRMLPDAEVIALGQMNATLALAEQTAALVEQQRIANLLAYDESLVENERDGHILNSAGRARGELIEAQVVDGLGLA